MSYTADLFAPTPNTCAAFVRWHYARSRRAGIGARKAWTAAQQEWKAREDARRVSAEALAFVAPERARSRVVDQPPSARSFERMGGAW